MHYQDDNNHIHNKVWTESELHTHLRELFAGNDLLLPDDEFYGNKRNKDALEQMLRVIKGQLKLRKTVNLQLSHNVAFPGLCTKHEKTYTITLPAHLVAKPMVAAAAISHLATHILLESKSITHRDKTQNETLITYAVVESGLGVVLLNGLRPGGWRSLLPRHDHTQLLGSLQYSAYLQLLETAFRLQSLKVQKQLPKHIVYWELSALNMKKPKRRQLLVFKRAAQFHARSLRGFVIFILLGTALASSAIALGLRKPAYLSPSIADKRQAADSLRLAYDGCIERLRLFETAIPQDDLAAARLASAETVKCKSLQNRYNAAAREYNAALQNL